MYAHVSINDKMGTYPPKPKLVQINFPETKSGCVCEYHCAVAAVGALVSMERRSAAYLMRQ
ncbi:hypothetical protein HH310_41920 [Actinoplanes sp. TBRC 11911]|uniref:hypothetical protein n=1 Tax=Actinoplanes sp. TBRC 11911 TaxID=2729386 RepID=UPI00145F490A|nr:hypothetical protein [Actinoplanes sp. TBRC 11911]NMO57708.1 hypothetical protein [Actinoplanes sp. TBRC 11911]